MVLCLKTWESRSLPGLPKTAKSSTHVRLDLFIGLITRHLVDAGWSSPVARQAHNLKVTGSNPVPATKYKTPREKNLRGVFCVGGTPCATPARKCLASCPGPLKTTSPSTQVGRHGQQRGPEREALPHRASAGLKTLTDRNTEPQQPPWVHDPLTEMRNFTRRISLEAQC